MAYLRNTNQKLGVWERGVVSKPSFKNCVADFDSSPSDGALLLNICPNSYEQSLYIHISTKSLRLSPLSRISDHRKWCQDRCYFCEGKKGKKIIHFLVNFPNGFNNRYHMQNIMFSKIKYHFWDLKKRGIEDHTWEKKSLSCYGRNITLIIGSF